MPTKEQFEHACKVCEINFKVIKEYLQGEMQRQAFTTADYDKMKVQYEYLNILHNTMKNLQETE